MRCLFSFFLTIFLLFIDENSGQITIPNFPNQAEFLMEAIVFDGQTPRVLMDIIYDYDANRVVAKTDQTTEIFYYNSLKKGIYFTNGVQQCKTFDIDVDNPADGFAAVTNPNDNSTHVRTLGEFLFLSMNATYLGETTIRGFIQVDQWISSVSNDTDIVWFVAKNGYPMSIDSTNYSVPIQRLIKRKDTGETLHILNIFKYRIDIDEKDLIAPQGIYCDDLIEPDDFVSLQDVGMVFPERFSVRIDATTTSRHLWTSGRIRYVASNKRKLIRYDFTPGDNTGNPQTIILDYNENIYRSYQIDRRTGFCLINDTVEIISSNTILHNPIENLIKFENFLLSNPPHRIVQYVGERRCRGSIMCSIYIAELPSFPPDSENNWIYSSVEWAWAKHNRDETTSPYDYPVYLHLNLYRSSNDVPASVHYEFYDYRQDVYLNEFDTSICYRSNQLWYQHLAFQLILTNQNSINDLENYVVNRRDLAQSIRTQLAHVMNVTLLRVSQVELDHTVNPSDRNESLYCIFTLLDRTPFSDPNSEIELLDAQRQFETILDANQFEIETTDGFSLRGLPKSLENIQYFYSYNGNRTTNGTVQYLNITIQRNRTYEVVIEQIREIVEYSDGAQAGAVVGGMFVGIVSGTLIVLAVFYTLKRKANRSTSGGLTFRNISFRIRSNHKQEDQATITMENPTND